MSPSPNLLQKVNPRSRSTIGVAILLTPFVALVGLLAFHFFAEAVGLAPPPEQIRLPYRAGQPPNPWLLAGGLAVVFAFLAQAWVKLIYGLITGKGGTLVPLWVSYTFLGSSFLLGAGFFLFSLWRGDLRGLARSIQVTGFSASLGLLLLQQRKKNRQP